MIDLDARLDFARKLAREVGINVREGFGRTAAIEKGSPDGYDIVTWYDRAAEAHIKSRILEAYNEPVLGEEAGLEGTAADARNHLWICDPIDGTFNFQRGIPVFGVSIACCADYVPVLGVIYLPMFDAMYYAAADRGAYRILGQDDQPLPLQVGTATALQKITIELGGDAYYALFEAARKHDLPRRSLRSLFSAVFTLAGVAAGNMDGACFTSINVWDVAAADILIREAGGPPLSNENMTPFFPSAVEARLDHGDSRKRLVFAASNLSVLQLLRSIVETARSLP